MKEIQLLIGSAWLVLSVVGRWLLLQKAGKPGWHSFIPIVNIFDEYAICWKGGKIFLLALLAAVAGGCAAAAQDNPVYLTVASVAVLWSLVIHWKQSMKLAASFGKGSGYGLFLFLFNKVGRVVLGLSDAQYEGKASEDARQPGAGYAGAV